MKKIILILLIAFYSSNSFAFESGDVSGLSLEECLSMALTNHPSLKKSKAATKGAYASLEQIKSSNRVKVSMSGRTSFAGDYKDWDSRYHSEGLSITASKTLYDTGVNKLNRKIQNENIESSIDNERLTQLNVAANAKKAYYDLVLKILNADVEHEKLNNLEQHLKSAKGTFEVGTSPYIDVTKAEADVANAKVSVLKAENDILTSQEALRVAMGVRDYNDFNLALSTKLLSPQPAGEIEKLLDTAMTDRADYSQILHTIKRRELEIKTAARNSTPTITGSLNSDISKREGSSAARDYSAQISVNIPIEDGGETKARIEIAKAQLEQDLADKESLENTIRQEVRNAALTLTNAMDRIKSSQAGVKYAEENLTLANGRYEVGVSDTLEVSDAVSTLASSRYTFYQALYDAQIARTELDKAIGHFPSEISKEFY